MISNDIQEEIPYLRYPLFYYRGGDNRFVDFALIDYLCSMITNNAHQPLKVLLTGSEGMLGSYIRNLFKNHNITGLNRRVSSGGISCDLSAQVPVLPDTPFDLVIHAAGSRMEESAIDTNLTGTKNLLTALTQAPPKSLVFISDAAVYGMSGGENIDESHNTWATEKVGQSKILAEEEILRWGEEHGVTVTILRPAPMFGSGISGEMETLFHEVLSGRYVHIRGNEARKGIVTAYDVARAVFLLHDKGGVYNVADGRNRTLLDLVNAMSTNAGVSKRMMFLPPKWAALAARIPWIPLTLSPKILKQRSTTITYNAAKLISDAAFQPFDTVEVIARRDPDFPYAE